MTRIARTILIALALLALTSTFNTPSATAQTGDWEETFTLNEEEVTFKYWRRTIAFYLQCPGETTGTLQRQGIRAEWIDDIIQDPDSGSIFKISHASGTMIQIWNGQQFVGYKYANGRPSHDPLYKSDDGNLIVYGLENSEGNSTFEGLLIFNDGKWSSPNYDNPDRINTADSAKLFGTTFQITHSNWDDDSKAPKVTYYDIGSYSGNFYTYGDDDPYINKVVPKAKASVKFEGKKFKLQRKVYEGHTVLSSLVIETTDTQFVKNGTTLVYISDGEGAAMYLIKLMVLRASPSDAPSARRFTLERQAGLEHIDFGRPLFIQAAKK